MMSSKQIVRIVSVGRSRSPEQSLDASGRRQNTTASVVEAMPRNRGKKVKLVYFKPDESAYKDGWLPCQVLENEYKKRRLVPDPQAQTDDNAAHPGFADSKPNACQWKDEDDHWCYIAFDSYQGVRDVLVNQDDNDWHSRWWYAGVPQESVSSDT